jgi:hypothetical protein
VRTDDEIRSVEQQGVAIGCGARCSFGSDHCARAGPVFDHDTRPVRPPDLLSQQAGQDIETTARGKWNNELDDVR